MVLALTNGCLNNISAPTCSPRPVEMKYAALLKSVAKQMGYQVVWSPLEIVSGSVNPPPSTRYPGLKCYMALVRVGSKEYSGFGPTPVAARNFAASQAYLDICFQLQQERNRESESVSESVLCPGSPPGCEGEGELPQSVIDARENWSPNKTVCEATMSNREENPVITGDDDQFLERFANKCCVYFNSVKDTKSELKSVSTPTSSVSSSVQCFNETTHASSTNIGSVLNENLVESENFIQSENTVQSEGIAQQKVEETSRDVQNHETATQVTDIEMTAQPTTCANPIGQLQELLMQAKLPLPKYSTRSRTQNGVTVFDCVVVASDFTGNGKFHSFCYKLCI